MFSYGTLQLETVQIETFGRTLQGTGDMLYGYKLEQLPITDPKVLLKSKRRFHPIAVPSNDPVNAIKGSLYKISTEELRKADAYEVSDYKRIKATFASGKQGWVYVKS